MSHTDSPYRRFAPLFLLAACLAALLSGQSIVLGATLPAGFNETLVASGLSQPTAMAEAPDGRIFIAQQGGAVRVVKNGALLPSNFVTLPVNSSGERGVLGVAFDPAFASNAYVYLYYTATTPTLHNRVSRFTASGDVAVAGSELPLIDLPTLGATNHNGGALHFGPDGKLYVAVGDNAVGSHSQTLANPFGKMLRVNRDGSIPADNPFYASTSGLNRAIWAYGLRNPFTFAFDPQGGTLFINDVGQNTWEEVNEGAAGANYGWPTTEGPTSDPRFVSPFYSYNHNNGCSIVGAAFYRPPVLQFPAAYAGQYFFGDYCGGYIRRLDPATGAVVSFATGISSLVDILVARDGSLYYLSRGSGALYQVRYAALPAISAPPQGRTVSLGQEVTFSVTASGTPPLTYQWQRNDVDISGATSASYTFTPALSDSGATFRVIVRNSAGSTTSSRATLTVTSTNPTAPVAAITQPATGALYSAGTTLSYAGTGTDAEDGALPASAFTWEILFHHDTHTHPFLAPTRGVRSGSVAIPTTGETSANVFYRIHLSVTDSGGRTHQVTRDVRPRTSTLTLATNPAGLSVTLDGQPLATPQSVTSVVGVRRSLGVVTPQVVSGQTYQFASWSDGGGATHTVATAATNTTYTATFTPVPNGGSIALEAEDLARTSTGATTVIESDGSASGGAWVALAADGIGDTVGFTTPVIPAGTYQLRLRYKRYSQRGQLQARVDGVAVGQTLDQYSPSISYAEANLGSVTFGAAGPHVFQLAVTGKHASSSGFKLSADRFILAPVAAPSRFEAEDAVLSQAVVAQAHGGYTGTGFVDTQQVAGAYVEWQVNAPTAGDYRLEFRYANGGGSNRPVAVRVNGALVDGALAMPASGSWSAWTTASIDATLKAGANAVRITSTTAQGTGNIDHLVMRP